ncbi:MAG: GNAT family N-acetyltransferase [Chitinophagales bacterium]
MIFRLASQEDFLQLYRLYMDPSSNPWLTYDLMSEDNFRIIFLDILKSKTLYVVEIGQELVSTYRLIPKTDRQAHTIYLGGFTVSYAHRGNGFGRMVLDHIKKDAIEQGKKRIELTVDLYNEAAITLYRKFGFEIEGIIKMSYRLSETNIYFDEYLMALIL